jgi:DNA-directed RNA polymerase subunit RPC12/RpoP
MEVPTNKESIKIYSKLGAQYKCSRCYCEYFEPGELRVEIFDDCDDDGEDVILEVPHMLTKCIECGTPFERKLSQLVTRQEKRMNH